MINISSSILYRQYLAGILIFFVAVCWKLSIHLDPHNADQQNASLLNLIQFYTVSSTCTYSEPKSSSSGKLVTNTGTVQYMSIRTAHTGVSQYGCAGITIKGGSQIYNTLLFKYNDLDMTSLVV
jgi:hypothetical protein